MITGTTWQAGMQQQTDTVKSKTLNAAVHEWRTCLPELGRRLLSQDGIDKQRSMVHDSNEAVVGKEDKEEQDVAKV